MVNLLSMNYVCFFVMYLTLSERCPSQRFCQTLKEKFCLGLQIKLLLGKGYYVLRFQLVVKHQFDKPDPN